MHFKFNASVDDVFIWSNNKNGIYTAKSGYSWLLSRKDPVIISNPPSTWSWVLKFQLLEQIKFLFWLACHNSVPTLSMLNHRNIAPSPVCFWRGHHDETFLHCVKDCNHSRIIWQRLSFNQPDFFTNSVNHDWLKTNSVGPLTFIFAATVWWA